MKLWGGRFQKDTDLLVNELNASISFDQRLYREDITGSMAHAAMLADCGIISKEDAAAITSGLEDILADIEAGKAAFTADNEDIHMNVEALLTARIGDAGKRLHTARSRNDQVALDFRMYVREQIPVIVGQLLELETVLCRQAKKHQTAVMPGYTHLQRAQPISFAQHLMAYAAMFRRDVTRLEDCGARLDECPLGSGALAGTTYPIDRWETAKALGFAAPMGNSLDGVSDRDYALEFLAVCDTHMTELAAKANVVLPGTGFASTDGTYTNTERRLQPVTAAIDEDIFLSNWEIAAEIAEIFEEVFGWETEQDISDEMCDTVPAYKYAEIGEVLDGVLVPTDEAKLVVVGDGAAFDALPCTDSLMQCITDRLPKPANPTA